MPKDTFHNLKPDKKDRIIQAAIQEFAQYHYNEANLSRIIKDAGIARGSFYQYFEDKQDLFRYLFEVMAKEKLKYLGDLLPNPEQIPFVELFGQLLKGGVQFALANPDFIRITRNLMGNRGMDIYQDVLGDNLELAKQYYRSYIEADKALGRIRQDVDTDLLTHIIVETSTTLSFVELTQHQDVDLDRLYDQMERFLDILKKGIER
jgi:AcrR family transcriptional regulator